MGSEWIYRIIVDHDAEARAAFPVAQEGRADRGVILTAGHCHAVMGSLGEPDDGFGLGLYKLPKLSTFAFLGDHAAAVSQASRMLWISAGVGWSG